MDKSVLRWFAAAAWLALGTSPREGGVIVKSESANFRRSLEWWPAWVFVGSATAYCVGYIKLLYFFRWMDVVVEPISVYPTIAIFVTGLVLLVKASLVPFVLTVVGMSIRPLVRHVALWLRLIIGFVTTWAILLLMVETNNVTSQMLGQGIIPIATYEIRRYLPGYLREPVVTLPVLGTLIVVYGMRSAKRRVISFVPIFLWILLSVSSETTQTKFGRSATTPIAHGVGIAGNIVTTTPIAPASRLGVRGWPKDAYVTYGVLLSRMDGTYFFLPWEDNKVSYLEGLVEELKALRLERSTYADWGDESNAQRIDEWIAEVKR